jgi:hypothetical protein
MANTIVAGNGTNNGLAVTSDNTGALNILTGSGAGTAAISIDASQNVTAAANLTVTGTLTASSGVSGSIRSGTAVASTSGTSIDFTSLPTGLKRITVMFQGVSTNGTSPLQIQIGAGSITTSGYLGVVSNASSTVATETRTSGFPVMHANAQTADATVHGNALIALQNTNAWVENCVVGKTGSVNVTCFGGGSITLGGTLDRVRITTVNGTDTFDAGSINILFE